MYTSEFFYSHRWSHGKISSYEINQKMVDQIKSLKSHHSGESGYYDDMLQWRIEDNTNLTQKDLNDLYPAMQFIAMIGVVKPEFIQKYNVQDWEISLLRSLYLDWDDYDSEGLITMGARVLVTEIDPICAFKRPFGNSHVLGDVREEMVRYGDQLAIERDRNDSDDFSIEQDSLNHFVNLLDKFYQEGFELKINCFKQKKISNKYNSDNHDWREYADKKFRLHSYLFDWQPDVSVIRDQKINEVLS